MSEERHERGDERGIRRLILRAIAEGRDERVQHLTRELAHRVNRRDRNQKEHLKRRG